MAGLEQSPNDKHNNEPSKAFDPKNFTPIGRAASFYKIIASQEAVVGWREDMEDPDLRQATMLRLEHLRKDLSSALELGLALDIFPGHQRLFLNSLQ